MSRTLSLLLVTLMVLSPLQEAWAQAAPALPIQKILLYKHGVAYFERSGSVAGQTEVTLEFKASEMNDVLKSLTLIDRAGGKVGGVSYEASDPVTKQLEDFAFKVPAEASLGQVLDQFKGARLLLRTPAGEVRGSILGVRRTIRTVNDRAAGEVEIASLLLENGELRAVPLADAIELRLEDPKLQRDLANYLSIVAGGRRRELRSLRIHPGNAKDLSVGYVIEAPVWKTSYRLVTYLRKPGEALLQGWAIVDNPSNEDWRGVELSLVSGLPISFTQNLYEPHYMRRPHVSLPYEMAVAPTMHEGAIVGAEREMAGVVGGVGGRLDASRMRQMQAKSQVAAEMGQVAAAPPAPMQMADMLQQSVAAVTQGRELGDLFEYKVEDRIDIPKHQSAMIPFVQTQVKAERVLLYDPAAGRENPYDALLLTNTSGLTLDGGAVTVLEGDRYIGEAMVETLKAGETRPVSFAVDLGTRMTTAFDSRADQVTSVKVHRGIITASSKNVEVRTYTIRNVDAKAKTLMIQHPVRQGWKLTGETRPEETTAQHYRFRVPLPANQTTKVAVNEEFQVSNTVALNNLNSDLLAIYVRNKALGPEAQKKLEDLMALKDRLAEATQKVNTTQVEVNELRGDQDRLRQNINNLRGLPGQEAQVARYAAKLAEQEKTVEALQATLTAARTSVRQIQASVDQAMRTLEI